jgi:hypothetical protein
MRHPSRVWWYIPVIPVFWRLKQEDHEFKAILSYAARIRL